MSNIILLNSISIGKFQFYSILPFQKVTLSLYHPILQYLQHSKTLFLLKYYFLIILYYFFPTITFFLDLVFLGFPTVIFFLFFSLNLQHWFNTQSHTHIPMIHRSTYPNPSPQTQSHTYTQTQTQTIKPSTKPYTYKPSTKPYTYKPSNQLEQTTATTPTT